MKNNNVRAISIRTKTGCELVDPKAYRIDIDIPSERQLLQRRVEQLIRYDRARMAARLDGARMDEYLNHVPRDVTLNHVPMDVTPSPAPYAPEPRKSLLISLAKAWVRLWCR